MTESNAEKRPTPANGLSPAFLCRECGTWARDPITLETHHRNCQWHSDRLVDLIGRLLRGIEWWAQQEDGVPDELWEAYKSARLVMGMEPGSEGRP